MIEPNAQHDRAEATSHVASLDDGGLSIVLLTFNSAASIKRTLASLQGLSDDVHVVDSFSSDDTVAICRDAGCYVVQRAFTGYANQRNWAIEKLPLRHAWQLHLDADEELTPELATWISRLDLQTVSADGYIIGRKIVFMGRVLRHGGIARTWHYRLFRTGFGRCEDRLYDQHFIGNGRTDVLNAYVLDHQEASLSGWTIAHNRWSDMESAEVLEALEPESGQVAQRLRGNRIERKRYLKGRYYQLPLFWRALAYFLYRYIVRLGVLDGCRGLVFHVLQGFWFRFLVDAKIYEAGTSRRG